MNNLVNKGEIKKAEKKLKQLTGGFFLNDTYSKILEKHNIATIEGIKIRDKVKEEIKSGKISSSDVKDRLIDLLVEYTEKHDEYVEKSFKFVDDLFETPQIKEMIKISGLTEAHTLNIENDLKREIKAEPLGKYDEEKIKSLVENAILTESININKEKLEEFKKEWVKNLENLIKDSGQDIELTDHEIRYIKNRNGNFVNATSIEEINTKLNIITEKVLSNRQLIGEYDSAGTLTEDGGVKNRGVFSKKHLVKAPDKQSDVFIKINEDNFILTETTQKDYFDENPIFRQRTFFFKDLIFLNKGVKIPIVSLGIEKDYFFKPGFEFNLTNNEKFKLSFDDEEKIDLFYDKWEYFKQNNENEVSSSPQESDKSIGEDILKYAELYEKGLLTEEEFTALKKKLLGL